MEKKNRFAPFFGAMILCGFVFIALASGSSNKSYEESFRDGYEIGRAFRQAISEQPLIETDTIAITMNDLAMND